MNNDTSKPSVESIRCPSCGGGINRSGKCPWCGNHNLVRGMPEEYKNFGYTTYSSRLNGQITSCFSSFSSYERNY